MRASKWHIHNVLLVITLYDRAASCDVGETVTVSTINSHLIFFLPLFLYKAICTGIRPISELMYYASIFKVGVQFCFLSTMQSNCCKQSNAAIAYRAFTNSHLSKNVCCWPAYLISILVIKKLATHKR